TVSFPAGTLGGDMDCFMLLRRDDARKVILGYAVSADSTAYFGAIDPNSTISAHSGGAPVSYAVNGNPVPLPKRGELALAVPVGEWCAVEAKNLNLSAWTALAFGGYAGSLFKGS